MSELTNKELDAIKARLKAVTPGPWVIRREGGDITAIDSLDDQTVLAGAWNSATDNLHPLEVEPADAEFITHARTDVARLVAEVERLNERLRARAVPDYSEECPTEPGRYRAFRGDDDTTCLIANYDGLFMVEFPCDFNVILPLAFKMGWRFAGPIPEPKEGRDE